MGEQVAAGPANQETLYDRTFVALCAAVFLGFSCFAIVGPVIPVVVLELGGNAFVVGLIIAIYSIPSVLLRPFMGRLVDEWSRWRVFGLGAAVLGLSSFLYLVPGLGFMALVRLLNGAAFAAFNTGGNATLATLAPPARRGEAAAIYNLMPSLAYMFAPAAGLLLLSAVGAGAAFLAAGFLGTAGALVIALGPLRDRGRPAPPARVSTWRSLFERRAVLPMLVSFLWVSANVLFVIYPPVWATAHDIPIATLAIYYPIVGAVLVLSRIIIGRRLDRVPRGVAMLAGAGGGAAALLVAASADTILLLTVAGSVFAFSSSAVSPTAAAVAIDRADPQRRGVTMATYSMGFPLGNGIGALAWGFVIGAFGFPVPFIAALVWLARADLLRPRPSAAAPGAG